MSRVIPPLCLLLTVLLLVAGFALLAREKPQPSIRLHEATASGDEERRELLEAELVGVTPQVLGEGSLFAA